MDSSKKILVVDDEKDYCFFMSEYLVKQGYSVDSAYDGASAVELMNENEYGLILFDCNMPEISGMELIPLITEKNPNARKVMISAYDGINEQFARDLGVDSFITKPFPLTALENLIKEG